MVKRKTTPKTAQLVIMQMQELFPLILDREKCLTDSRFQVSRLIWRTRPLPKLELDYYTVDFVNEDGRRVPKYVRLESPKLVLSDGRHRILAMSELGFTQIPCIFYPSWDSDCPLEFENLTLGDFEGTILR